MSYVREVLQPGEEIRFRTNVHWLVYLPAMVMFVLGIVFASWYTAAASQHLMLVILSGLSAVAGVLLFIPAWLKRFGTEIAVTDRRVIYKTGLVQRDTTEINMPKIESVDVRQPHGPDHGQTKPPAPSALHCTPLGSSRPSANTVTYSLLGNRNPPRSSAATRVPSGRM